MLEQLFGSKNIEKVIFFLLVNERCYGKQLSSVFNQAIFPLQNALDRLEKGGVIVSFLEGRNRVYQFNPRYPFLEELKSFLTKAYQFLPDDLKEQFYEPKVRRRPRRKGKPL